MPDHPPEPFRFIYRDENGEAPSELPGGPFRFVYQDESGDVARSRCNFIVGLLFVREREPIRTAVAAVRQAFNFRNELHFSKLSGLRSRVYRATFQALSSVEPYFAFRAILVKRERLDLRWFGGQRHLAYNFFTKLLLQRHAAEVSGAMMYADEKVRMREDNFFTYLASELNLSAARLVLQKVESVVSREDDILQVTDLLTGCANVLAGGGSSGTRKQEICEEALRLRILQADSLWEWTG